jgi:hypothetical protein
MHRQSRLSSGYSKGLKRWNYGKRKSVGSL